jgi:nucleolar protein 53
MRLRKVADGHHEDIVEVTNTVYDPWASTDDAVPKKHAHDHRDDAKKAPKAYYQKPVSLSADGKPIPAVSKPSGGFSYNPAFNDYQARLVEESDKAIDAEQKRLAAQEAERIRMEAASRSAAEADAAEARAELSEWDEDSEWEGFQSGGEELSVSVKRPERKTPAQRNKIKRRKEEERRLKHEVKTQLKKEQAERIKQIAQEVALREQALAVIHAEEDDGDVEGNEEVLRRKQLGKMKLPEKDLELVLPDELQDSLRLLRPEGNLLKDRYRSLLVRGKMEARRKIPFRKQAKTKLTEKWTYKDFRI